MEDVAEMSRHISCNVCNGNEFDLRAGFYYCTECGTQQMMRVELDDEQYHSGLRLNTQKIQKTKETGPELTSWECYNYILRGFVDILLSFGAKEELKLMTLQLWAAYLRRMEVAFFNKKREDMPRLGPRFFQRDARTLYNYVKQKRKRRRSQRSEEESNLRKLTRDLDKSTYSLHSSTQSCVNTSMSSFYSSSTGTTSRPIRLKFSASARRTFKKIMPLKHLEKHAENSELGCHKLQANVRSLNRTYHTLNTMNIKQVHAILAIALNLIEDDIQLSDLLFLICEEHIGTKQIFQYFPDSILPHCQQTLIDIDFHIYPSKYSDKAFRQHVGAMGKFICLREFKTPDIVKLTKRYVKELQLPVELAVFIERIINTLPPEMKTREEFAYGPYEARAMAYIVFALKLLFGLDGYKEKVISTSACRVNEKVKECSNEDRAPLFVWSEWVKYIEMRKIILSQYSSTMCKRYKQSQTTQKIIAELNEEYKKEFDEEIRCAGERILDKTKSETMQHIFETLMNWAPISDENESPILTPSLTPSHTYFQQMLNFSEHDLSLSFKIPSYMRVNHTARKLEPYLDAKELHAFFDSHAVKLNVAALSCNEAKKFVGVFHVKVINTEALAFRADFDINEESWKKTIPHLPPVDEIDSFTKFTKYTKEYLRRLALKTNTLKETTRNIQAHSEETRLDSTLSTNKNNKDDELLKAPTPSQPDVQRANTALSSDLLSMHSYDVFLESNMSPLNNVDLSTPRRNMNNVDLQKSVGKIATEPEVKVLTKIEVEGHVEQEQEVTLHTSAFDYWMLMGSVYRLTEVQKKILGSKLPREFLWLLETCAQTIGIEWIALYEQLLTLEVMFGHGIENLENFEDCLHFKYTNEIREINTVVKNFRVLW